MAVGQRILVGFRPAAALDGWAVDARTEEGLVLSPRIYCGVIVEVESNPATSAG